MRAHPNRLQRGTVEIGATSLATRRGLLICLTTATLAGGCRGDADATALSRELDRRNVQLEKELADSNRDGNAPLARWLLPRTLSEISGLTLTPDGRLFAHDDEHSRVSEIDPRKGIVVKEFHLKGRHTHDDFEGITVAESTFYMITSHGRIYAFREGGNRSEVAYTVFDTRLGQECEFEGITFDPRALQLVMPCKHVAARNLRDHLVLFRIGLPLEAGSRAQRQAIPMDAFRGTYPWKSLHPTDIARDPITGDYVLVAAHQHALIELTPAGAVLRAVPLPPGHDQAEGVAVTADRILIVCDEAQAHPAAITLYRWPLKPGGHAS